MNSTLLNRTLLASTISASLLLFGCGGESDSSATPSTSASASSTYIKFDGSVNGESVVDANNQYVKFLANTRTMETLDKLPTDITLDSSNRIIQGGGTVIGAIKLVAGSSNSTIAGLVANNGTMLAVDTSAGGASLKNTNVTFAKPSTASPSTSSPSTNTGAAASCAKKPYTGDSSDPQVYSFDYIAQVDQCIYRATGNTAVVTEGNANCKILNQTYIVSGLSSFKPQYCAGDYMIK